LKISFLEKYFKEEKRNARDEGGAGDSKEPGKENFNEFFPVDQSFSFDSANAHHSRSNHLSGT
jgi:hypothetical protein